MAGVKGRSGGARAGSGRHPFKPTKTQRKLVEQLSAFGIRVDEMPAFITDKNGKSISRSTLTKYFKTEIDTGRVKANAKVANALFRNATESTDKSPHGNIAAQIFWLKTRCGWSEARVTDIEGARIPGGVLVVPASVSMNDWESLATNSEKA